MGGKRGGDEEGGVSLAAEASEKFVSESKGNDRRSNAFEGSGTWADRNVSKEMTVGWVVGRCQAVAKIRGEMREKVGGGGDRRDSSDSGNTRRQSNEVGSVRVRLRVEAREGRGGGGRETRANRKTLLGTTRRRGECALAWEGEGDGRRRRRRRGRGGQVEGAVD